MLPLVKRSSHWLPYSMDLTAHLIIVQKALSLLKSVAAACSIKPLLLTYVPRYLDTQRYIEAPRLRGAGPSRLIQKTTAASYLGTTVVRIKKR